MGKKMKKNVKDIGNNSNGKCDSETLIPTRVDLFSKDSLIVYANCPKNHETDFTLKKK